MPNFIPIIYAVLFSSVAGYAQKSKNDTLILKKPKSLIVLPSAAKIDVPLSSELKKPQFQSPIPIKPKFLDSSYFNTINIGKVIKSIKVKGTGFIETRYSNWKDTLTNMPQSFVRVMLNPTITISGIPFSGNIYYSTENGPISGNLKNINFRFDNQQFTNDIYQRIYGQKRDLLQTLNSAEYKKPELDLDFDKQMSNYENQIKKTQSPEMPDISQTWKGPEGAAKTRIMSNLDKLEKLPANQVNHLLDSISMQNPLKANQLKQLLQLDSFINLKEKDFGRVQDSLKMYDYNKYVQLKDLRQAEDIKKFSSDNLQSNLPELEKAGLISKADKIMLNFKKAGIGDTYPIYTPFTLMGMKIRGIDLQYCPNNYIFSFTGGISPQVVAINRFLFNQDNQNVFAGSLGYGKLTTSYIRVSYVEARSHSSLNYDSMIYPANKKFSRVYTTDFAYKVNKSIIIKGELANSNVADNPPLEYYPEQSFTPRTPLITKDKNWAGDLSLKYTDEKLKYILSGEIKQIETNFISYAMPFLRTDYLQYQIKVEKQLFEKRVFIEAYWINEIDNLSGRQSASSIINSFGGSLGLYLDKLPYLLLSYNPTSMATQSILDTFHSQSSFKTYTAQAGYQASIANIILLSSVNAFAQEENFTISSQASHHKMIWISETIKFKFPLTMSLNAGYLNIRYAGVDINSNNYDCNLTYAISKKINFGIGYARDLYQGTGDKETIVMKINILLNNVHQISLLAGRIEAISDKDATNNTFYNISLKYAFKW